MTESIGQRLKKAREYRGLTLEKAAEATRIRPGYLKALETDDFSALPSPVQARGFLRNYAQYLDLDVEQIVDEFRAAQSVPKPEVVFEGEKTIPVRPREESKPEVKPEETPAETAAEPFWQTWLRRAKSEVGEPEQTVAPASLSGDSVPPAQEPVTVPETEADQGDEVDANGSGAMADLLVERMKALVPRRQPKPVRQVQVREEPKPEPEPELEPEVPAEPVSASQEIINEIGMQLHRRREMLSLTLDEIERHTRLRVEVMDALERGDFENLPSPVQTRGMLANYAGFLDLEVDALLLRYADALQARHRERHPEKPARRRGQPNIPENLPRFRSLIAGDVVFGIGMVLLLVGFSVWGISRVIAFQGEQELEVPADEAGPSISEALIGTPMETVVAEITLIPAEDTPIPELTAVVENTEGTFEVPTFAATGNVQVNIVALERSFLRVSVDGEVVFEGRTIPGNAYPFEAEQSVEVLAGNGSALRVIYNQRDLGLLGGFGQIASFIYTADEILIPTPAMSPTATFTPFISPTPTVTLPPTNTPVTPSPTLTPRAVATPGG